MFFCFFNIKTARYGCDNFSLYIFCLYYLCGIHKELFYFCGVIRTHDNEIDGVYNPEAVAEVILQNELIYSTKVSILLYKCKGCFRLNVRKGCHEKTDFCFQKIVYGCICFCSRSWHLPFFKKSISLFRWAINPFSTKAAFSAWAL